ncbi:MAG: Stf0 family sulfotransferase [Rhodospirillaceae bacterium]|nr:Stf0 family sulfotransferase [Rhodospirillaceae bacterium]
MTKEVQILDTTKKLTMDELRQLRVSDKFDSTGHPVRQSYIILAEIRSGSSLLSDMLQRRGAGIPIEYFKSHYRLDIVARINRGRPISFSEYSDALRSLRTTENGYFGIKCTSHQFLRLESECSLQGFLENFDHIIVLSRRNKLAQAISAMRAQQTGAWLSTMQSNANQVGTFDPLFISERIRRFIAQERTIRAVLKTVDRPKLFLDYEMIETSLATVWHDVQAFLDLEPVPVDDVRTDLTRQADAQSLNFARRYLRHIQGLDRAAPRNPPSKESL